MGRSLADLEAGYLRQRPNLVGAKDDVLTGVVVGDDVVVRRLTDFRSGHGRPLVDRTLFAWVEPWVRL